MRRSPARARSTVPGAPGVRLKGVVRLAVEATRTRRREGGRCADLWVRSLPHTVQEPVASGSDRPYRASIRAAEPLAQSTKCCGLAGVLERRQLSILGTACPSTVSTTQPATTSASSSTLRRTSSPVMSSWSRTDERRSSRLVSRPSRVRGRWSPCSRSWSRAIAFGFRSPSERRRPFGSLGTASTRCPRRGTRQSAAPTKTWLPNPPSSSLSGRTQRPLFVFRRVVDA